MRGLLILAAMAAATGPAEAGSAIWSIDWASGPVECRPSTEFMSMRGPLLSPYSPACSFKGVPVSICSSGTPDTDPWNEGRPISVIGYDITCQVNSAQAQCVAEAGSAHGGDGADIFARTAGVGSNGRSAWFPTGADIPQGPVPKAPHFEHFDVYAQCDGGSDVSMQVLLSIYYTAAVAP